MVPMRTTGPHKVGVYTRESPKEVAKACVRTHTHRYTPTHTDRHMQTKFYNQVCVK